MKTSREKWHAWQFVCTVTKVIDFPRYNMKCSWEYVILRGIFHVVSPFHIHFMLHRGSLDYFWDSPLLRYSYFSSISVTDVFHQRPGNFPLPQSTVQYRSVGRHLTEYKQGCYLLEPKVFGRNRCRIFYPTLLDSWNIKKIDSKILIQKTFE